MKTVTKKISAMIVMLAALSCTLTQCTETTANELQKSLEGAYLENGVALGELSDETIAGILFMREEEKLARDVYLYLYEIYPLRPFENIARSEQAHMDAIRYLVDLYNLEDPVAENPTGIFKNKELQQLYNTLIERGSQSKEEALRVGALIEEVDIIDLQNEMEKVTEHEQITRVYNNLCRASENHLRAFVRVQKMNGVEYTPVELDFDSFSEIIYN